MNAPLLKFWVPGEPIPQGSKKAVPVKSHGVWARDRRSGRPIVSMMDDNPRLKPWREMVERRARAAWGGRPISIGPMIVVATFYFDRPKYHYRTGRFAAELRPDAPMFHLVKPDVDKLVRAIADALTGVVYSDDAQIIQMDPAKRWSHAHGGARRAEGVRILIEEPQRDEDSEFAMDDKI